MKRKFSLSDAIFLVQPKATRVYHRYSLKKNEKNYLLQGKGEKDKVTVKRNKNTKGREKERREM